MLMPSDTVPYDMIVILYTRSLSSESYSDHVCLATAGLSHYAAVRATQEAISSNEHTKDQNQIDKWPKVAIIIYSNPY